MAAMETTSEGLNFDENTGETANNRPSWICTNLAKVQAGVIKLCGLVKRNYRVLFPSSNASPYAGPDIYRMRELSDAEKHHLDKALLDPRLEGRWLSRLLGDQFNRFKTWPMFFDSVESSGKELRDGFASIWSTFIIAHTLLASLAVSPFIRDLQLNSWKFKVYGTLWFLALTLDFVGLITTITFLAFLHSIPAKLSYIWVCNLGAWMAVPIILAISSAVTSAVALTFTLWVIYGKYPGIFFAIIEVCVVLFCIKAANALARATVTAEGLVRNREA